MNRVITYTEQKTERDSANETCTSALQFPAGCPQAEAYTGNARPERNAPTQKC